MRRFGWNVGCDFSWGFSIFFQKVWGFKALLIGISIILTTFKGMGRKKIEVKLIRNERLRNVPI